MLSDVLKTLEQQKSYSRAGRLMEGRAAAKNVSLFNQKPPPPPLDMGKMLSVAEVSNGERGGDAEAMCSSARDHPSVALKNAYVTVSEKRNLFDNSLSTFIKQPPPSENADDLNQSRPRSAANGSVYAGASPADFSQSPVSPIRSSHQRPHATDASLLKRDPANSSAFLAIPRERAQGPLVQNPPVGHYNPRYTAVDPAEPNCILPKQVKRRHLNAGTPHPRGTSPIGGEASLNAKPRPGSAMDIPTPASDALKPMSGGPNANASGNRSGAASVLLDAQGRPLQPTWPFRSRTVAHHDSTAQSMPSHMLGPAPTPHSHNESLLMKRQPVLCNMAKEQGRVEPPRTVSVDLMYHPAIQRQIKVAHIRLDRTTGRGDDGRAPRTSNDVERAQSRLNTDNYAKFKYTKESVIANFDSYPSKEVWINNGIATKLNQTTHRSEIPLSSGTTLLESMDRTRDVSFNKMVPRKAAKLSEGFGLEYDVTNDFKVKHEPSIHLDKMPERRLNASPASDVSQVMYHPNIDKFKKKLTQTITFDSYPDREKRAKTGRASPAVFHETQAALDLNVDALALPPTMRPILKGDPHMSTHASRAKRERALNPPTDSHDLVYTYTVDDFQKPLRKGAVGFDQMVSREAHGGSTFANSMKGMMRK